MAATAALSAAAVGDVAAGKSGVPERTRRYGLSAVVQWLGSSTGSSDSGTALTPDCPLSGRTAGTGHVAGLYAAISAT